MKNNIKRERAIKLFPFFPLDKRNQLHEYLIKIPEYVEFNDDNRRMPSVLFNDITNTELNLIIHWFIVNRINQNILPKIYNAIYDGMIELEPNINNMVVNDTTAELIQPLFANVIENDKSYNNSKLPVAIPLGGKRIKSKRIKSKRIKSKRIKSKRIKSKRGKKNNLIFLE